MNKALLISLLFFSFNFFGQESVHNFGNLQLHDEGLLGFHTDFINDGSFDKNLGLIGFYHKEHDLIISGAFGPAFYDFEVATEGNLLLETPIYITNSLNFIYGNIISPKGNKNVYTQLSGNAFHQGAINLSKIEGQVAVVGQKTFSFPVGNDQNMRPLQIKFVDGPFLAKCAYFHENPAFPSSFNKRFDTNLKDFTLVAIHSEEFWNVTTSGIIQITLNWNSDSNMRSIIEEVENVTIAGWSKTNQKWANLGNAECNGQVNEGSVKSKAFNANDYEIFTFGTLLSPSNDSKNYALTPNGDGANDFFYLELLEDYPLNNLTIFDRDGRVVYEKSNYKNQFNGISNKSNNPNEQALPNGVYFYILDLKEPGLQYQGYIYLAY